jgi:uncharacterized membrane protein (UPF0127 family)
VTGARRIAFAALCIALAAAVARADAGGIGRLPTVPATIGGERFALEVAREPAAQQRGLGGRDAIDPHGGMLFVFPAVQPLVFVMRDCPIPIDLAFLDRQGRVINVHPMQPEAPRAPGESAGAYEARLRLYPSALPAQYAVEVAGGRLAALGVRSGDKIEIDLGALAP